MLTSLCLSFLISQAYEELNGNSGKILSVTFDIC